MFQDNDQGRRSVLAVAQVIDEFRRLNPRMEATQMLCFLLIAAKPGVNVKDLEARLDISNSALSRNILELSSRGYAKDRPGHDLVAAFASPTDARQNIASPTVRGRRLVDRIAQIIQGAAGATHGATTG